MGALLEVLVVTIGMSAVGVLIWGAITRGRQQDPSRAFNANHHGLYLLVNTLVAIQERGYQPIFPDVETLDRARELLGDYEGLLVALPPRVPPGPGEVTQR